MNNFGRNSRKHLCTADARLQRIAHRVLRIKDHSIIQGHRGKRSQDAAFNADPPRTYLPWPKGKHNKKPSLAIDVQTYPRPDGEEAIREEQIYLLGIYKGVAQEQGILVRTGADFDRDGQVSDSTWYDLFHVEIDE